MEPLRIEATSKTPEILFDATNEVFEIKGKSIPGDAEQFFSPITSWIEDYVSKPNHSTLFKIDLEYFNISSSKRILNILYKLHELVEKGLNIIIEWHYNEDEEDMLEVGEDYEFMVRIPFKYVKHELVHHQ